MTLFAAASPIETRGSAKAGLSWPGQLDAKFAEPLKAGDLSWYFNWGPTPSNGPGEFVSMIWGPQPDNAPVPAGIPAGAVILGFDEPDGCGGGQSCMTLDAAIREWKKTMNKLADQGHRICAPATAGDGADPNGWLAQFMERCRNDADCRKPSCLRVHTYQSNIDALKGYVSTMHNRFPDLQIWLTEFADHNFGGAVNPTQMQQVHDFMGQVTKWLDETPWIERYAWFGAGNQQSLMGVNPLNRLQNDDWSLTNLGRQYAHGRHT